MSKPTALGLELVGHLGKNEVVLDVVLAAKVLDADGDIVLIHMATPNVTTWEAAGMSQALADRLRRATVEYFENDEDEDG